MIDTSLRSLILTGVRVMCMPLPGLHDQPGSAPEQRAAVVEPAPQDWWKHYGPDGA